MSVVQRSGDLFQNSGCLFEAEAFFRLQYGFERDSVDELHEDDARVWGRDDIVDRYNPRVAEKGRDTGFSEEAFFDVILDLGSRHIESDVFDGNGSVEGGVAGRRCDRDR